MPRPRNHANSLLAAAGARRRDSTTRLLGLLAVALAMTLALLPDAAAASGPGDTFVDEFVYEDVNPCTGEPRTVHATYTVKLHEHPNGATVVIQMSEVLSDGSVVRGRQAANDNLVRGFAHGGFNFTSVDAEGNRLVGHDKWRFDVESGEFTVDRRWYTCTA